MNDSDIKALKRRSVRGSGLTFIAQGIKSLIKLGAQIAIARLLLPTDYGLVAMVAPILALSYLVGELGLGQAVILQPSISTREVSSLFWFSLALNSGIAAVVMLISPAIAWLYGEPRTIDITLALAALLPVTGIAAQHIALLNREMRYTALGILDVVPPATGLVCGLIAARQGWGYWALVVYPTAQAITTLVAAWALCDWRPGRPWRGASITKLLTTGGHITGCNVVGFLVLSTDNVLLGVFRGSAELGLYDRGRRLTLQALEQLLTPVSRVAIPLLMRLRSDPARYRLAYLDTVQMILLMTTPGIPFAGIMAHPLMVFLLGPQWAGVAPIFSWLCLGGLVSPLYSSAFWLYTTQDRTHQQVIYVSITSAASILAFVAGLPWGAVGVAAGGTLAFTLISVPLVCWGATRRGIVSMRNLLRALWPLAVASGVTAAVLRLAQNALPFEGVQPLAVTAPLAYGVFIGTLLCLPFGQPLIRRAWHFGRLLTFPAKG